MEKGKGTGKTPGSQRGRRENEKAAQNSCAAADWLGSLWRRGGEPMPSPEIANPLRTRVQSLLCYVGQEFSIPY
jgi:hypothetical protein